MQENGRQENGTLPRDAKYLHLRRNCPHFAIKASANVSRRCKKAMPKAEEEKPKISISLEAFQRWSEDRKVRGQPGLMPGANLTNGKGDGRQVSFLAS